MLVSKFERAFLDPNGHTFFRSTFRPYSNFAIESVENQFQQSPDFNKQTSSRITNQGDVIIGGYLEIITSALTTATVSGAATQVGWTNSFGHAVVDETQFKIGGIEFDKQYGEWLEIYSEFFISESHRASYNEMIGKFPDDDIATLDGNGVAANTYIVPMRYWWEKPGVGLPSAALEGVDIEITVRFRPAAQCVVSDASVSSLATNPTFEAKFWIDFAFVSDEERAELVAAPQTYLITQIMRSVSDTLTFQTSSQDSNFTLHFNLPANDLIWVIQNDADVAGTTVTNKHFKYGIGSGANETDFISSALLKINNTNREEPRGPLYFRNYRPQRTHTHSPEAFMYEFAFSLHPEAFQPSGTMNFSKTDSATLVLTKKGSTDVAALAGVTAIARAYIRKLNTVTVVRGMFYYLLFYFNFENIYSQTNLLFYYSLFIIIINRSRWIRLRFIDLLDFTIYTFTFTINNKQVGEEESRSAHNAEVT